MNYKIPKVRKAKKRTLIQKNSDINLFDCE